LRPRPLSRLREQLARATGKVGIDKRELGADRTEVAVADGKRAERLGRAERV
jgi:hypothetical protein